MDNPTLGLAAIRAIAEHFQIKGKVVGYTQNLKGYINRTFFLETQPFFGSTRMYTLQQINTAVFPDVDLLMSNYRKTSDYLRQTLNLPGRPEEDSLQTVIPTLDGGSYYRDGNACWRMLSHFCDVYSLDIPKNPETFYYTGFSFGSFLREINKYPVDEFKAVIPNFHNTQSRYEDLERVIEANPVDRADEVAREIRFVREHRALFPMISSRLEDGTLPYRITHNDCNLNNILFDNLTDKPVAIIDLDTVMPGSPLYDFGDSIRIGTNTAVDDEKDLSKVHFNIGLYEQYARGYLEACGEMLTKEELALLPYAALVITSEDGIRFLMDYINGDTYYTISYDKQNLDRCRTQLALLADMEAQLDDIKALLARLYAQFGLEGNPYQY